jgi:hypothetical protein
MRLSLQTCAGTACPRVSATVRWTP